MTGVEFPTASRSALEPTLHPIQWLSGALCPGGKAALGVKLTAHVHHLPRLRMMELHLNSFTYLHDRLLN
jgi:hypothetical protein